eukprot:snap_masked-scaffold_9-processed-gene-0.21-mRNA-1 protein AED:1.00 eAED:1.00 QI:0/-1/0/0/-1/1/1/0/784
MSNEENLELLQRGQDYKTWRIRIKAKLMEEGLFKTIDTQREKYEASTTGKITLSSAEQKNNGKAMAIVLGKISNNMLEKVEACEDMYSMWKKLENLFKVDEREERRRSFEVLEHPRGSTRVARIEDFDTNLRRFVTAGGLMHEDQKIARLLNVIKHDRVTQLKIVVEDNPEVYNYDKVFNKLLHLSNILDRMRPILGRNARGSRGRGRGGYRNANPQQKCYNCGERGHIRARCTKLICENCKGIGHEADECKKPKMKTEYRANMAEKKQQYESQNDFYNDYDSVTTSRTEKKTMYSNKSVNVAILNIEKEKNQNKNQIIEENQNKKQKNTKKQNKNYINFLWDSGASSHLISMDKIKHVKDIEKIEGETLDGVASTTKLNLKGNMTVKLGKLEIDLKDVYIIDTEKPVAIISIGKVSTDNDIKTEIDGKGINIKTSNGERIERIEANQNLYKKNLEVIKQRKDKKNSFSWHKYFGHPSKQLLLRTLQYHQLKPTEMDKLDICKTCSRTKDQRVPIGKHREKRSEKPLQRVYCDTLDIPVRSNNGYKGCLVMVDDFSKYRIIRMYRKKKNVPQMLIQEIKYTEERTERKIKCVFSDQGKEFMNKSVVNFLAENGTQRRYSSTYTPQHNGPAERSNRIIISGIKIFLQQAKLPMKYWPYAAEEYIRVKNISINSTTEKSPHELLFGTKPKIKFVFTFGEEVTYIDTKIKNKIKPKNKFGRYIGKSRFSSESKILDNVSKQIILSRDIRTLRRSMTNLKQGNKIKNDEDKYATEQGKSQSEPPSTYQ